MTEPRKLAGGQLGRNALSHEPLSTEEVERIYRLRGLSDQAEIIAESHERLRGRLEYADASYHEAAEHIARIEAMLTYERNRAARLETALRRVVSELTDPVGSPLDASEQAEILRAAGLEVPDGA